MTKQNQISMAAALGVAGTLCATGMIVFGDTRDLAFVNATPVHMLVVSGPSAALAGWMCRGLFGRRGGIGWFFAGAGAFLATLLGAAIGGTLIVPMTGTIFAPLIVFWNLVVYPWAGLVWLFTMMSVHILAFKTNGYAVSAA